MDFETYVSYDALGLADLVQRREVSPDELLDAALARTAAVNPAINAVQFPREKKARAEIAGGLPAGPFQGVPWLVKDLYADVAGEPMTNGSRLWKDNVCTIDSELVQRYRRAGLVIFGRTASPELGLTPNTENRVYGSTHNPWKLTHSAGGSSGGASAAVAAGIIPAAHATDGGGSIRIPATCCGLFGLKPTRGRVPMGPLAGEGWGGMSAAHAVTRSVRDSAALLDATAGPDLGAPYWAQPPLRPFLDEVGAATGRLRVAFMNHSWLDVDIDPDCLAAVDDAARLCRELGHEVEEAAPVFDTEALGAATGVVIGTNIAATLNARAAELGIEIGPEDIEAQTEAMRGFGGHMTGERYVGAIRTIHATGRALARFMERYDVLLTPTMACVPFELGRLSLSRTDGNGYATDVRRAIAFTSLFNATGQPAMSVPLFWNADNLPVGVQFAGRYGDEATLFRLAAQLEEARPWFNRRPPL